MKHRVQFSHVRYFGGHPSYEEPKDGVVLVLDDKGVHLRVLTEKFVIPWADVRDVAIEGPEQANKRVTVTRVLALGIFSLGAQKTTSEAYLQVETDAFSVGFMIPKTSAGELRGQLAPWVKRLSTGPGEQD